MPNTTRGTICAINETQSIGSKGFRKRLVVLEQNEGRWSNFVPVEFLQDDCDAVDDFCIGDEIDITFALQGRKWQKSADAPVQYFLACQAISWRTISSSGVKDDVSVDDTDEYQPAEDMPF